MFAFVLSSIRIRVTFRFAFCSVRVYTYYLLSITDFFNIRFIHFKLLRQS